MVARNTTSEFFPSPPKTRLGSFGHVTCGFSGIAVIQPGAAHNGRLNMSTVPVTNGDRVAGIASSKALSVKGITSRL